MKLFPLVAKRLELLRNQTLSREKLEALQLKKFRKLVRYVNEHSSYYRGLVSQHGISIENCRPEDFPVLTKQDVVHHFDQIVTKSDVNKQDIIGFLEKSKDPRELYLNKYYVLNTSGSSGEIGYFIFSQEDWVRGFAQAARVHEIQLHPIKQAFVGAALGHYAGVTLLYSGQFIGRRKIYDVSVFNINQPISDLIEQLNQYMPDRLIGYAEVLHILAEQKHEGKLKINPSWIDSGGEVLTDDVRGFIESVFKVPVRNLYASSEFLFMGYGQRDFHGMILLEDDLIFEIENNATIVTGLFNYTFPLIRYRMNDILEPLSGGHAGWPYRRVGQIVGRTEQAPVFINEKGEKDAINPIVISELFVKKLRKFQLHVKSELSFVMLACFEPDIVAKQRARAVDDLHRRVNAILEGKKMTNVRFEIRVVDDIPVDSRSGKFRLIVNDYN